MSGLQENIQLTLEQTLDSSIAEKRRTLVTDRLDMSFGEIISLYESEELTVNPKYQRLFRWDRNRMTNFIESLILSIPIPPIFVFEDENSEWELVDGLQRISTVLSFFGKLNDPDKDNWILVKGNLIPGLKNYNSKTLPLKYIRSIKRSVCRMEILKTGSDANVKYELFKRLNTGGELLTDQEVRNCIFRGKSEDFNHLLEKLVKDENFTNLIKFSEKEQRELFNQELVLRFFALTDNYIRLNKSLSKFLDEYMLTSLNDTGYNYKAKEMFFVDVFKFLKDMPDLFLSQKINRFSRSKFEGIVIPIALNFNHCRNYKKSWIRKIAKKIIDDPLYKQVEGSGASHNKRIKTRIEVGNRIILGDKDGSV